MDDKSIIEPRRSKVVVEEYEPVEKGGLILDIGETKKDTQLYSYKVISVGPAEDCVDITPGAIVLCLPSDLQIFKYNGKEYYLVDSDFISGFAYL